MTAPPPPILILAPPRSFTTLASGMLGVHPQVFGVPELMLFYYETIGDLWRYGRSFPAIDTRVRHGLLRAVSEIVFGEQTDESVMAAEYWCGRRQHWPAREVFAELQSLVAPLRILEKSPDYSAKPDAMLRFFEGFPDAQIIYLTRHPIGQCKSAINIGEGDYPYLSNSFAYEGDQAIADPQIAWHDMNVNILNFLETHVPPAKRMQIKGEVLLAEPEAELKKICQWLGLRSDNGAMEAMMHPERSSFAAFGPISALFGNDPNFLRNPFFTTQPARKLPPLDQPLPWREDGATLYPEVIALAQELGY